MENKNYNYILPLYAKGAPRPAYMVRIELRVVKNPRMEDFGKYYIITDMHYEPLNLKGSFTFDEAHKILSDAGCIAVKDTFDQYSVEDLREIKQHLSAEWVEGFNNSQKFNY